ncbi:BamA/TamA family outer membrane protein [Lysobacter sp. F60174L2]|uniref:BamA/TamA family outer membrane protein n=1 Tax=Lysobacter sp. F60174L2 TaxID=3459295 RepID=UPI00403DC3CC
MRTRRFSGLYRWLCAATLMVLAGRVFAQVPQDNEPVTTDDAVTLNDGDDRDAGEGGEDGAFDMSSWLLEHKGGFLPVPIIVTDPTLGEGGGLGLAFFRPPAGGLKSRTDAEGNAQMIMPDIYAVMAMRTSNGSEVYGAGAQLHFKEDSWRYSGGIAKTSINLGFHTPGDILLPSREIGYNTDGVVSLQKVSRRIGGNDILVGLAWIYMDMDVSFDVDDDRLFFDDGQLASTSSGIGLSIEYDTRDNSFTPSRGWLGMLEANAYDDFIGSDSDFQSYRTHVYGYMPIGERVVLGGRVDIRWANGDIPFYRLPYIDLRGIGAARYQDRRAAVLETEVRYNLTPRWALVGFAGAGRTWGRHNSFGDGSDKVAKGTGFRYLLARKLGLYVGVDYAWGPEDETFYLQIGSAWR